MGFEIINKLKKEKGLTNAQVAQMAGITLSTLDKITSGINTNPKLGTLQAICSVLGCTLNDFSDTPITERLSTDERTHIKKYRLLDPYGKEAVDGVLDVESRRCEVARAAALKEQREQMDAGEEISIDEEVEAYRQRRILEKKQESQTYVAKERDVG